MIASPKVAIIDCGVGNHTSVYNALTLLKIPAAITCDPEAIASSTHLIFPGVGSFAEGMEGIKERGLLELLQEEVMVRKKRILGICLGMQLFVSEGFEHGHFKGLGFIPGKVIKIDTTASGLRLPHIGWNDVHVIGDHQITKGFDRPPIFYFVHSYHVVPDDPSVIAGVCDYGVDVTALIEHANVFGAQFHPEKSHDDGMQIFKNFLEM
ncbi:imidazole glycerol phosphate synthase, glutamine amidotransferase subunit [Candidatus Peribacteria bacterium RIFCSPLOWO2_12_FULL_55_15]|nr:MAG: imidazole glycerol phosphate synthase, glutamine amidotransferase subunit [Candidatus Peribacteria bacterium RIFCSPHIGHO2_01_FULL_54_22]OGJ63290.1 MAG: imidazole glycerol phosphate synthase, glutamine amidotransferase subunit [Candidatus Peribacteria bacterium RIFCSPHIGHO2_02_FULL_55_24]OGJ63878.1 MAG: imidazole glycerol phosphate synthase, glutamine amidotransferase subunit [Candidatus Peribacteria bacterium RIFCSPHIGHO2_12_FULL_54_10]OGJ67171.1 MAG: imidazole glycerol phosphate synthas